MYFDFETALTQVKSTKTKKYLQEVLSTYHNQEYRACIMTLYVTTFVDAFEKIKISAEAYQNEKAEEFLEKYEENRKKDVKYSQLEKNIMDFIINNRFINDVEEKQWNHLKDYRDFCAHPVMDSDNELISPNESQVKMHIRNMLEALFLKDAILLGNKLFEEFVLKAKDFYDRNGFDGLEKYIDARYISKLDFNTKWRFVKNLWVFAFYGEDDECQNYRCVAYWSLIWIIKKDKHNLLEMIEKNIEYCSGKIKNDKVTLKIDDNNIEIFKSRTITFIFFLFRLPEIYRLLPKENQIDIKTTIKKNVNLILLSLFAYEDKNEYKKELQQSIKKINYCFDSGIMKVVYKEAIRKDNLFYNDILIYYFCQCQASKDWNADYYNINKTYSDILEMAIPNFDEVQIKKLLEELPRDYENATCFQLLAKQIVDNVKEKGFDVDFSKYKVNVLKYQRSNQDK
jgi:hypothetical protein